MRAAELSTGDSVPQVFGEADAEHAPAEADSSFFGRIYDRERAVCEPLFLCSSLRWVRVRAEVPDAAAHVDSTLTHR